jgi:hypothetical protein
VVDVVGAPGDEIARATLQMSGLAAVVATEWMAGQSLARVTPGSGWGVAAVLRAVAPLAEAVDNAHRRGVVVGCAHPQRVRVGVDGARVAFGLPGPRMTMADDVRGLGALMYLLLTGYWPLPATDDELAELPRAPRAGQRGAGHREPRAAVASVSELRPGLPVEVGTLVMGALGVRGQAEQVVRTAAAVRRLIGEALAARAVAVLPPPNDGPPSDPDEVWHTSSFPAITAPRPAWRKPSVGVIGLGAVLVALLVYGAVKLCELFGLTPARPPTIVVPPSATSSGAGVSTSVPGVATPGNGKAVANGGLVAPGTPPR